MPAAKDKSPAVVSFRRENETKNKVRFEELNGAGDPASNSEAVIGKLYVSKELIASKGDPESLKVTLEFS